MPMLSGTNRTRPVVHGAAPAVFAGTVADQTALTRINRIERIDRAGRRRPAQCRRRRRRANGFISSPNSGVSSTINIAT